MCDIFYFIQLLFGRAVPRQLLFFVAPFMRSPLDPVPNVHFSPGGVLPSWRGSPAYRCTQKQSRNKDNPAESTPHPASLQRPGGGPLLRPPLSNLDGGPWFPATILMFVLSISSNYIYPAMYSTPGPKGRDRKCPNVRV